MAARTADILRHALAAHQRGDLATAAPGYEAVLRTDPDNFDALHMLGVVRLQQRRHDEALWLLQSAVRRKPRSAEASSNLGIVLQSLGRFAEAIDFHDRAIAVNKRYINAHFGRGNALLALNDPAAALASFEASLAVDPTFVPALINRALALRALGRNDDALACYERVLAIAPGHVEALHNRGNLLHALGRFEAAAESYERALAIRPDSAEILNNRGHTLNALHRHQEALACLDRALAIAPTFAMALVNAGNALQALDRAEDAVAWYDRAIASAPDNAEAHYNRANALVTLGRHADAIAGYEQALAHDPGHGHAPGALFHAAQLGCCWPKLTALSGLIEDHVANRRSLVTPFTIVSYSTELSHQLACSRHYVERLYPGGAAAHRGETRQPGHRIRIAYLSSDFHRHATAYLTAGLFERHDRARFEVTGISFGRDDKSEMRARLIAAFDRFEDVAAHSDRAVAERLAELKIDIAIDLKGHTEGARPGIFALRPAPIQVSYLGFPGTTGAPFIDYILADHTVVPAGDEPLYTEKVIRLPGCYQVNDAKRAIAPAVPSRAAERLPEQGFVFCCFNQSYKITEPVFEAWMRLLRGVEGSVLWLIRAGELAETNLRAAAAARGIDPERLVFAEKQSLEDHLSRHRLADLFVDTLPYNAHTTASDALWTGLPVLTCRGSTFAGRVAASLLQAVGLPELVTENLRDYEALALELARDAAELAAIRSRLAQKRATCSLFDTDLHRRNIEAAYQGMWTRWQNGQAPESFDIEPA
jgi:predicted O-linked N-acetylglucosamine transferase (SPINDLY family)